MYEGKNIHFSPVDNKPLCSFSAKVCKQRRLNGYAFCVRHILEDPGAPFKSCAYVAKLSQQQCHNPLPKNDVRQYCNYHMQVLGLATKPPPKSRSQIKTKDKNKEVKVKDKETKVKDLLENRMTLEDRLKKRFNLHQRQNGPSDDDPDDPYAFPDTGSDLVKSRSETMRTSQQPALSPVFLKGQSPVVSQPGTPPSNHFGSKISPVVESNSNSNSNCGTPQNTNTTSSIPIAKLYPELAEKLEKARVKPEVKLKPEPKSSRSSNKSSRTMNRLQTKIAQNKIKDKLKKNQGQNNQVVSDSPSPHTPTSALQSALASEIKLPFSNIDNGIKLGKGPKIQMAPPPEYCPPQQTALQQQLLGIVSLTSSDPPPTIVTTPQISVSRVQSQDAHKQLQSTVDASIKVEGPTTLCEKSTAVTQHGSTVHHLPTKSNLFNQSSHKTPQSQSAANTVSSSSPVITSRQPSITSLSPSNKLKTDESTFPAIPAHLPGHYLPTGGRLKRSYNIMSKAEACQKLKSHSAVKMYAIHAQQKLKNSHFLPLGVDSSGDESDSNEEFPWQRVWYVPSSEDVLEEPDDGLFFSVRTTKLSLLRTRIRRQLTQLHRSQRANTNLRSLQLQFLESLIECTRKTTKAATKSIMMAKFPDMIDHEKPQIGVSPRPCLHKENDHDKKTAKCGANTLPFTNHCKKHIMYNVDQQLYDFCTAKFSDNTQCCVPVFDIKHELPLCPEHAAKADNYQKNPDPRPKKPRKKTKPSALTRPPKKGKKKKNQKRNVRPQKPMPPLESTGNTEMPSTPPSLEVDIESEAHSSSEASHQQPKAMAASDCQANPDYEAQANHKVLQTNGVPDVVEGAEITSALSPDTIDKSLELPMDTEQATKFLDEHDLHDVFDKLPDDAFDIFTGELMTGKNGEFMTSNEATEALERALAEASRDVNSLESSALSLMNENSNDDELTKQIADSILNQDLGSPGNPLDGDMSDDLATDNLQDLANISTAELKNISNALPSVLTPGLPDQAVLALQGQSQLVGQAQQLLGHNRGPGQVQGQGPISVIQAQLAQGPLTQGQFQIQMPGSLAGTSFTINAQGALIPSSTQPATSHGQFPAGQGGSISPASFNCNGSNALPQFSNLLGNGSPAGINSSQVISTSPITSSGSTPQTVTTWGQGQTPQHRPSSVTLQQGHPGQLQAGQSQFPVMQATLTSPGMTQGGVKVAYPLQAFLPNATDLATMITNQSIEQALNINLGTQSLPLNQESLRTVQKQPSPNT